MSRMSQIVATTYSLSIAAGDEASRLDAREIDLEHVLLALVIDEGTAGQALRSLGITLAAARAAVADQHREQLASLGVDADLPEAGRIRSLERGAYDWTKRASNLLTADAGDGSPAVLRALLAEPSGTVEAILARLGQTPADVADRLDQSQRIPAPDEEPHHRLARTRATFVPAPPEDVWSLVSDPERLPEWEMNLAFVAQVGDTWEGATRTTAPDGADLKVRPPYRRQSIVRRLAERPHRVAWEMRYPDAPRANSKSIAIDIEPAAGGSQVTVAFAWVRGPGPTGVLRLIAPLTRLVAQPFLRPVLWIQVTALTSAISRAFRA